MTMQSRKRLVPFAWLVAIAAALLCGGIAQAKELSVCIDTASSMVAVDNQLARAVAAQEGATLQVHDYNSDQNDDVNGMADFGKLARTCDLVLGFPLDTDAKNIDLGGLHATRPYAHSRFVMVTRKASKAAALGQLPRGSKVAIVFLTPPNLYMPQHPDLQPVVAIHDSNAFEDLATRKVDAALLWGPAVTGYEARHANADLAVHALDQPHSVFNLVALYDSAHASDAAEFERAIASAKASGELQKILGKYAVAGAAHGADPAASATQDPVASAPAVAADPPSSSGATHPAIYTSAQATAGLHQFLDNCSMCHGPTLEGGVGPALKGKHFAAPSFDYHVGDIFTIVAQNMPADQPGSLKHQTYVEIMAYLLQQNGYPAGSKALTYEGAMKSKVKFISGGK